MLNISSFRAVISDSRWIITNESFTIELSDPSFNGLEGLRTCRVEHCRFSEFTGCTIVIPDVSSSIIIYRLYVSLNPYRLCWLWSSYTRHLAETKLFCFLLLLVIYSCSFHMHAPSCMVQQSCTQRCQHWLLSAAVSRSAGQQVSRSAGQQQRRRETERESKTSLFVSIYRYGIFCVHIIITIIIHNSIRY